jgi:branched-chain amino acid transport system permease protein
VVDNPFLVSVIVTAYVTAIAVYGMDIMWGRTGQLSLAHAGFFGIGGYSTGILMTSYGLSFWAALPLALLITSALGYLVGMAALRTRHDYFAIFTLAVGVMITIVIERWESLTGGTDGLIGIPPPAAIGPLRFESLTSQYYLALFFLLLTIYLVWSLVTSLVGRTLVAVHHGEDLARAVGIDVGRTHRLAFVLSVAFAGLGGALYAVFLGYIGPAMGSVLMTFMMLVYLMLGGVASLAGPLVGTLAVTILLQGLHVFEEHQMMLLGPVVVLVMIFFPRGLVGLANRLALASRGRGRVSQISEKGATSMGSSEGVGRP